MSRETSVSQAMTADVVTFKPTDQVTDAMQRLVDRGISGAPVVDDAGTVVGMLTTSDLIVQESRLHVPTVLSILGATIELPSAKRQFEEDLRKALGSTVGEVMQSDPVCIDVADTVEEAATLLHSHDISRLPVVSDDGLVGIVTRADIVKFMIRDDTAES